MRVIVVSDTHLSPSQSRIQGAAWDAKRHSYVSWLEANDRLDEVVDYANQNNVDLLVVGGDMFDSGSPASEAVAMCWDTLSRLHSSIKVLIAEGNHDQRSVHTRHRTPVEAYLGNHPRVARVSKRFEVVDHCGFQVAMLPWVRVGGRSELEEAEKTLSDAVKELADQGAHMLSGHVMLSEWDIARGSEESMTTSVLEANVSVKTLEEGPWSVAAIGHVHNRQFVGASGKVNYTGSTYMVTFNEEGEDKGFDVFDFDNVSGALLARKFVKLGGARLYSIRYGDRQRMEQVLSSVKAGDRVRLIVDPDDYSSAMEALPEFSSRGVFATAAPSRQKVFTAERTRVGMDVDTSPSQAMREYAARKGISDEDTERILGVFAALTDQ